MNRVIVDGRLSEAMTVRVLELVNEIVLDKECKVYVLSVNEDKIIPVAVKESVDGSKVRELENIHTGYSRSLICEDENQGSSSGFDNCKV